MSSLIGWAYTQNYPCVHDKSDLTVGISTQKDAGIILYIRPANERWRYIVRYIVHVPSSLIAWAHT